MFLITKCQQTNPNYTLMKMCEYIIDYKYKDEFIQYIDGGDGTECGEHLEYLGNLEDDG